MKRWIVLIFLAATLGLALNLSTYAAGSGGGGVKGSGGSTTTK